MLTILSALIPVFSLIIIGYLFKKIKFPSADFWPMADKLTYYILMPSLLIYKLSSANFSNIKSFDFILTPMISIFIILLFLFILSKFVFIKADIFTSVIQGAIRFNTYIFLALSNSLFGDEGLILAILIVSFMIPFLNIICIILFALLINKKEFKLIYLIKSIVLNPLIISCFIGGSINFLNISLPLVINETIAILAAAALPLGLLSIGFSLVIKEIKNYKKEIFISCLGKFLLFPLLTYFITIVFDLNYIMSAILLIFASLSTAPNSFIIARQLGGDIKSMSSIITIQTFLSLFSILIALEYLIKN